MAFNADRGPLRKDQEKRARRSRTGLPERLDHRGLPKSLVSSRMSPNQALNGGHELTEVNWLDHMVEKTHFPASLLVLLRAVAAHRDAT